MRALLIPKDVEEKNARSYYSTPNISKWLSRVVFRIPPEKNDSS